MQSRRAGTWYALLLILIAGFALVACGTGSPGEASKGRITSTSQGASTGEPTPTTDGNTTERETEALPGGGPVDQVFPPGDPAYQLLAAGRCAELKDKVSSWDDQGVADAEGADTVELYRSAAYACLGDWVQAIAAFHRISVPPDLGGNCVRSLVFAWLQPLIEAREADPQFEPEFVGSGEESQCPAETPSDEPSDVEESG